MLLQLNITNFAIIRHLEITLGSGLNTLSGETGAGKSIIINAMNLILGGRAYSELIRSGCDEARVEALFNFPQGPLSDELTAELGTPFDGELLISRSIFREGRNKITINGNLATLQMLSRLGTRLISISGQHEHQQLLRPENHLHLLDSFGMLTGLREEMQSVYADYISVKNEIRVLDRVLREEEERDALHRFQIDEIEKARLTPGEDDALEKEKRRLQNSEDLLEISAEALEVLYEAEESVTSLISRCMKRMDKVAEIDSRISSARDELSDILVQVEDTAFSLRDFKESINMDTSLLDEVLIRIDLINGLKRKYGPGIEEILRYRERLESAFYTMEEKKKRLTQLGQKLVELRADMEQKAAVLSEKRRAAAKRLKQAVEKELGQLHMKDTGFEVRFGTSTANGTGNADGDGPEIGPDGYDKIEFMISPNVGEEIRPLSRIASGGELSRIMLALKTILAQTNSIESVIFDEVDSGISGATAEVVGEKLLSLARFHQIVCITHLPQIASQGHVHFMVSKNVVDGRTETSILMLNGEERVLEIARLLGGRKITPHAVANAREMLRA